MNRRHRFLVRVIVLAALYAALPGWFGGLAMQAAWAVTDSQWTWMKGSSYGNQTGTYGTILTPAADNTAGARESAMSWTDPSGAFWLFGGNGYDSTGNFGYLNDLWKYDRTTGNWTWMKGASTATQSGTYGTILTPAAGNTPGSRQCAATWTDATGALWLFGGYGYDSAGNFSYLNDLWKYDRATGNWIWIKGSSTANNYGTYGTLGVPAATNTPGARQGSVSWTDHSGALWLFGGEGMGGTGVQGLLGDLWKFDTATYNWVWIKGSWLSAQAGVYGTILTPTVGNNPGSRYYATSWTDPSGAFWLFGGYGVDSMSYVGKLNDLWKYDPDSGNWAWMKGPDTGAHNGVYGTLGTPDTANIPGGRHCMVSWTDSSGALWLFGGYALDSLGNYSWINDLWKYDRTTGNWTWIKGADTTGQQATCGTLGKPDLANTPGARDFATSWTDSSGGLWLFGGSGYDLGGGYGKLNDLWRWQDAVRPTGTILINNNQSVINNPNVTLSLTWSDGIGSGVVRMKFSNDGTTWTAWEPLAATKAWALPAGEGYKTVRVMYRDKAGNNSAVYSDYIRVDTIPPTGSIIINGGASSTKNRVVSLGMTWSDGTGSGVTRMRFSLDGATWTAWEPQASPKTYTLPSTPGYYTVRVTYRDAGGNISERYNDYIRLDAP